VVTGVQGRKYLGVKSVGYSVSDRVLVDKNVQVRFVAKTRKKEVREMCATGRDLDPLLVLRSRWFFGPTGSKDQVNNPTDDPETNDSDDNRDGDLSAAAKRR